ncbi:hypothetical protein [Paenibacillus sp. GCM10028914]|uniref:hypothetical protein n=1 Tax=Paenibacillus sp. GCM10028914 TaxID=3273416 RepID=UPI003615B864
MSKFNSAMNLIKERPGMYLGKKSFTILYGFITGFSYAEFNNKLEDHSTLFPLPFRFFHEFVKVKHDAFPSRQLTGSNENRNPLYEPYFSDPEQIFLMKMSNNLGYLRVILTKKECYLVFKFCNHKQESIEYFQKIFGENLSWMKDEWKNEVLNNRELTWA